MRDIVAAEFFVPDDVTWSTTLDDVATHADATRAIRADLASLRTSHTHYFSADDPETLDLQGLFGLEGDPPRATSTTQGLLGARVTGGWRVRGVLDGSVAERAGLRRGDVLRDVDGAPFEPVESFTGRVDDEITLSFERDGAMHTTRWRVVAKSHADTYVDAARASASVHEVDGARVGVVHLWSFAGARHTDLLVELLTDGDLADADALVLDLRDGWGGAPPEAARLFGGRAPHLEFITRDGATQAVVPGDGPPRCWTRPVALLVDGRTRSGKEVLAHAFVTQRLGPVVGERTAGAVVGGAPFVLDDGGLLMLAVVDVRLDGERLEGVGVAPDVVVPRGAGPDDAPLDAALRLLARQVAVRAAR